MTWVSKILYQKTHGEELDTGRDQSKWRYTERSNQTSAFKMCQTWILEPDYIIQCISYEFKFRRAEQLMIESKAQEVSNLWKCLLQSMCLHRRERGKLQIYKLQKGWKKSRHCRFWQRERDEAEKGTKANSPSFFAQQSIHTIVYFTIYVICIKSYQP